MWNNEKSPKLLIQTQQAYFLQLQATYDINIHFITYVIKILQKERRALFKKKNNKQLSVFSSNSSFMIIKQI